MTSENTTVADDSGAPADADSSDALAQNLLESLQAGATIKELHGVSPELMEGVYAYAHRFYTQGRLDEAETFFRFLCLYDFYNGEYALGLGAVFQLKRQYQQAIDMYALAFALTQDDPRPMFHVGQCHLALGKVKLAQECFESVLKRPGNGELSARARAYLDALAASSDAVPADAPEAPPAPDSAT